MKCTPNERTRIITDNVFGEHSEAFQRFPETADECKSTSLCSHLTCMCIFLCLNVRIFVRLISVFIFAYAYVAVYLGQSIPEWTK